jgi:predicted transcriptional regulator
MPLLEVIQTRHLSASIRLTDTTAAQVDQYAAFIHASADEVVEQALAYVFSKDRDFQEFLKSAEAQRITPTLRVRRAPATEPIEQAPRKPENGVTNGSPSTASVAGSRA